MLLHPTTSEDMRSNHVLPVLGLLPAAHQSAAAPWRSGHRAHAACSPLPEYRVRAQLWYLAMDSSEEENSMVLLMLIRLCTVLGIVRLAISSGDDHDVACVWPRSAAAPLVLQCIMMFESAGCQLDATGGSLCH